VSASPQDAESSLDEYVAAVNAALVPDMRAGRVLLSAFTRHTGAFHAGLATPKGQRVFVRMCHSEISLAELVSRPSARLALSMLNRM
jgi:hypothetical protein